MEVSVVIDACRAELREYYAGISAAVTSLPFNPLKQQMDEYAAAHPEADTLSLKTAQYRIIAEQFTPHIFLDSPFWGETGLRIAEYDGAAGHSAGGWLLLRNQHLCRDADPERYERYMKAGWFGLHLTYGPFFDYDHHCFPYTAVLEKGLDRIQDEWAAAGQSGTISAEQKKYCDAVVAAIDAVRLTGQKFSHAAEEKLNRTPNLTECQRKNLLFVRDTAKEIPFRPPQNFKEALAALHFLHEIGNVMDGISISVLGHPDRMLKNWFSEGDPEAEELIAQYLLHTDLRVSTDKLTSEQYNGGEQADTLILGGDDWSPLSLLFLRTHRKLGLVNPKIHCRISAGTPEIYLKEIATDFLAGRNVLDCLNDDVLIPAQIRAGKSPADAARYVAGGCWEVILEGAEHSAGANCYLSLGKVMEFSVFSEPEIESALGIPFQKLDGAADFEEVFARYTANVRAVMQDVCRTIGELGAVWKNVNPCPFFSAPMCLDSLTDYTAGGAKYNPHGLPLTGLTIAVDSLLAIRELCFEKKICSLETLLDTIRKDWDNPLLQKAALAAPHFGDGAGDAAELAKRLLLAVLPAIDGISSERGGIFQPGLYSYNDVLYWANLTSALPNGRKQGDFLEQGLTPSRLKKSSGITSVLNDIAKLPLEYFPANSVLTASLQKNGLTEETFCALLRVFCKTGPGMLQLNCLSPEELLDAEQHPERHRDLLVRLYGYSVRFISLDEQRRKEFITRTLH